MHELLGLHENMQLQKLIQDLLIDVDKKLWFRVNENLCLIQIHVNVDASFFVIECDSACTMLVDKHHETRATKIIIIIIIVIFIAANYCNTLKH